VLWGSESPPLSLLDVAGDSLAAIADIGVYAAKKRLSDRASIEMLLDLTDFHFSLGC
jgi:hypothetical protein